MGSLGEPDNVAALCAKRAQELKKEAERNEQELREEAERKERAARKKKKIIKISISAAIVVALIFGAFAFINIMKAKKEREELASKTIKIERDVTIKDEAYSYDSEGNKILTLNNHMYS